MQAPKAASTLHPPAQSNGARPTLGQSPLEEDEYVRTKILLLGLRRSGKTSIQRVLFDELNPKHTIFTEPTTRLAKHKVDTFIPLEIWDCPGTVTVDTLGVPLSTFTSIIFVIDIQDSYHYPVVRLLEFFVTAFQEKPDINLEVFVHKAEVLSEDFRLESFLQVQSRVYEELSDLPSISVNVSTPAGLPPPSPADTAFDPIHIPVSFHLTSVYDHSLREAFARVFTHILSTNSLPYLEELLNAFVTTSSSSKAFIFDVKAKFFIATDSSPVDVTTLGLCCDYVHMLNQFGDLYKSKTSSPTTHVRRMNLPIAPPVPLLPPPIVSSLSSSPKSPKSPSTQSPPPLSSASSCSPTPIHTAISPQSSTGGTPMARSRSRTNSKPTSPATSANTGTSRFPEPHHAQHKLHQQKPIFHPSSAVSLAPYTTLVYHSITPRFVLVALMPTNVWEHKRGLVEYNIVYFREGVQEIYDVERESRRRKKTAPTVPQSQSTQPQPHPRMRK